jgi:hypothetical protein
MSFLLNRDYFFLVCQIEMTIELAIKEAVTIKATPIGIL